MKELTKLIKKLLEYNTQNTTNQSGGYTLPMLLYIKDRLEKLGADVKIQNYEIKTEVGKKPTVLGSRGNLIATIPLKTKKPAILFQGHVDTVPDESGFKPKVTKNFASGRGAVDMKSAVAGMVRAFEILLSKKESIAFSPILLLTSDEEAFNFSGIKKFLEKPPEMLSEVLFGICGEPTNLEVKNFLFGATYFIIKVSGKQMHSSTILTDNAIENSVGVLRGLLNLRKELLSRKVPTSAGVSILNLGLISGGEKVNQIPKECLIHFSIRNAEPIRNIEKLLEERVMKISSKAKLEKVFAYDPINVNLSKKSLLIIEKAFNTNKIQLKFSYIPAFSEATFLNNSGICCCVLGPGNPIYAHTDASNEKISIDQVKKYTDILVTMCMRPPKLF
ncbi:MAG: M20/M25/M40 family metallo-hydrolase [bacterium]